jgi:hypothetical protein
MEEPKGKIKNWMLTGAGALNPMAPNPARSFPTILRRSKNGKSAGPANKEISRFASQRVHSDWVPQRNDGAKAQQNNYLQGLVAACLPTTQIVVHQGLLTPALPSAHCPPATIIGQFENLKEGYNKERNWNNRKKWWKALTTIDSMESLGWKLLGPSSQR